MRQRTRAPRAPFYGSLLASSLVLLACLAVSPAAAQHPAAEPPHPAVSVEQDIAALRNFHIPAKEASRRLAARGDQILPALHAALASPEANAKQRVQLITLLAEIGDAGSVEQILAAAANANEPAVTREALAMLPYLTVEPVGYELAAGMLRDPAALPVVKRSALAYLALVRDERGAAWVEAYSADADVNLRAGALFLAAMLGDGSAKESIARLIDQQPPRSLRHGLLVGYAELATPDEMTRRIPENLQGTEEYASALNHSRLRTSAGAARSAAARELLQSPFVYDKKIAAGAIAAIEGPDALASLVGPETPRGVQEVVRHELRRQGYRVIRSENRFELQEREP